MVNFCKGCDVHMFFVEEIINICVIYNKKVARNYRLSGYLNEMFGQ